jgi:hypothetical protein
MKHRVSLCFTTPSIRQPLSKPLIDVNQSNKTMESIQRFDFIEATIFGEIKFNQDQLTQCS